MRSLLTLSTTISRLAASTLAARRRSTSAVLLAVGLAAGLRAQNDLENLPRPDGKPADMSKPVQVYILMGQSNMLGFGKVAGLADACKNKGLYPYLINEDGSWTVRKDVRYVRVMCSGSGPSKTYNNEWMTISGNIGPEMGIGHYVGHVTDAPVLILKSCIGNRSLGYDLLPPTAEGYAGNPNPPRRPKSGPWYAGVQYDGDVAAAKQVLANLGKYYPGARRYQVAGFFFWQGDKDFRNADHAANYERNLLCLIESLRKDFDAPEARFVCATLGQTRKGAGGNQGQILEAQLNIDGERGKYPRHKGKVATVYSHPLSRGGSSSGHYGGNAETYQNIGEAMGKAMAKMILGGPAAGVPGVKVAELDSSLKRAHDLLVAGKLSEADKTLQPYLVDASSKDEQHRAQARIMAEYLTEVVESAIRSMEELERRGDFCGLRNELTRTRRSHAGIPIYDKMLKAFTTALATEKAVAEMAIGDELATIVAKKKRTPTASYYGMVQGFLAKHPDSFYATMAQQEIAPIEAELRALIAEVDKLANRGDVYAQFEKIKEAERAFKRIPSFDEAQARWSVAAKDPAVRESIAAGKDYTEIFASVTKATERHAQEKTRNARKSPRAKAKANERATAAYHQRLAVLAGKLQKLADRHGDTYYGRAARRSYDAFVASDHKSLTDEREK